MFLIRSLNRGGAETQLLNLSHSLAARGNVVDLVTLEPIEINISNKINVNYTSLRKKGILSYFIVIIRLLSLVRNRKPDIIHGYMWDCNILSFLIAQTFPKIKLVFGIRCSIVKAEQYGKFSLFLSSLELLISKFTDCIISNSTDGINRYKQNTLMSKKCMVVYNGIDTNLFKYNALWRHHQRSEWGIKSGEKVIGMLARLDPMKGHEIFIETAIAICKSNSNTKFICVGRLHDLNLHEKLFNIINNENLGGRIRFYEESTNPVKILSALDVFCSPSMYGEGFSNSIAEAMSCGRICIATDVGEARNIIYDKNMICRHQDINCLKYVIEQSLNFDGVPSNNREHIIRNFSLKNLEIKSLAIFNKLYHSF